MVPENTHSDEDRTDAIYLTFSATEVGIIAMLIIRGVERRQAIRSMPRYTRRQYTEFSAFYDQLREAMEQAE
jgi:hypothetical protein